MRSMSVVVLVACLTVVGEPQLDSAETLRRKDAVARADSPHGSHLDLVCLLGADAAGEQKSNNEDAFWAAGFMGQITMVIPSRDVVVVRLGPSPGGSNQYLNEFVGRVLEALPQS